MADATIIVAELREALKLEMGPDRWMIFPKDFKTSWKRLADININTDPQDAFAEKIWVFHFICTDKRSDTIADDVSVLKVHRFKRKSMNLNPKRVVLNSSSATVEWGLECWRSMWWAMMDHGV